MFGNTSFNGEQELKLSSQGDIKIPSFTGVSADDYLALMFDLKRTKLMIYSIKEYENVLNEIKGWLDQKLANKEISYKQYLSYCRYVYGYISFGYQKVKSDLHLKLPTDAINKLSLTNKVYVVGNNTHLDIYPSKDSYLNRS